MEFNDAGVNKQPGSRSHPVLQGQLLSLSLVFTATIPVDLTKVVTHMANVKYNVYIDGSFLGLQKEPSYYCYFCGE